MKTGMQISARISQGRSRHESGVLLGVTGRFPACQASVTLSASGVEMSGGSIDVVDVNRPDDRLSFLPGFRRDGEGAVDAR